MKGRKPKPHLALVQDSAETKQSESAERQPLASPRHLKGEARKEWQRLVKVLDGVIMESDAAALSMICVTWGRHVAAERELAAGAGLMQTTPTGFVRPSPYLEISNRAAELFLRLGTEFGLTPSSRARLPAMPKKRDKPSPWDQYSKK